MREQLIQYVNLLFAGRVDAEDIKMEILQNTLDRYDDLVAEGKSPEAAYQLAVTGIGDIGEILGRSAPVPPSYVPAEVEKKSRGRNAGAAVAFFILCPVPVLILQNEIGMVLLLAMIAAGVLLLMRGNPEEAETKRSKPEEAPVDELRSGIHKVLRILSIIVFLALSFATGAWFITWLVFPLFGAVRGLVNACLDLKEDE